jgi:putative heme-binding domain-containing protein
MRAFVVIVVGSFLLTACKDHRPDSQSNLQLHADTTVTTYGPYVAIKLPINKGIKISNPIQLSKGPREVLFAANQTGEVYALHDSDRDGLEDSLALYCNVHDYGLRSPAGIAHRGDTIYVGTSQEIRAFIDTDQDGKADKSWPVIQGIPESGHPYEWTSALTIGPDGWLYCALATDSWNAAPSPDPEGYRGALLRVSPDGKVVERIATGVRSVYGIGFNRQGDLFFTDNEGGGNPNEELNLLRKKGFYGHNPAKYPHDSVIPPAYVLQTEVAPSGIAFNAVDNDFGGSAGNLFVAYYGPGERWNRGAIARIEIRQEANGGYSYNEIPVADISKISDLEFGMDGSLYVARHGMADYWYNAVYENQGAIYKLVYDPEYTSFATARKELPSVLSPNSVEAGKQLFAEAACLGCHQVDGTTELLGPNLKNIARQFSRSELLEEIVNPSARIKPSMMGQRIIKKDGQVLLGRVVSSDEQELSVMLIGNMVVQVPRSEIRETEAAKESLMYKGLLTGMSETDREALLDYLVSLSQ